MISVFVATSGRPEMFKNMLQSLRETSFGYDVEIVAAIDEDLDALEIAHKFDVDVNYSAFKRGALEAWNIALTQCQGDILIPTGDDQVFHKNWLKYALESHHAILDDYGVVGMNDLAYNGNTQVATMWMFDRQYCKEHMGGIFAPPVYKYYCVDLEWNEKAKQLGKFYWDDRSKVEHLHSAHGKRPVDAVDLSKDESWMERDNWVYEQRKSVGFPVVWEPII